MEVVARHVRVTGRVQGVFFRAWTRDQAGQLGVSGWVRNCEDGSVEAHLQGEAEALEQLIERMRRGPPSARVENFEIKDVPVGDFEELEVRH
jgi:acylphosphatase